MDYDSLNLRELTVFDLCSDQKLLDSFMIEGRECHLRAVAAMPSARWNAMLTLAEYTGDKALEAAVEKQFSDEIAALFNE